MTGSKRKPGARRKPKRLADADFVAQVVADSHSMLGMAGAAKKHGISERTVSRYRTLHLSGVSEDVSSRVVAKKAEVAAARQGKTLELLDFLEDCIRTAAASAAADGKLYEVAGAYKIVSDRVSADRATDLAFNDDDEDDEPAVEAKPLRLVSKGGA